MEPTFVKMEGLVETATVAFKTELTSFVNVPLDLLVKFAAFYMVIPVLQAPVVMEVSVSHSTSTLFVPVYLVT